MLAIDNKTVIYVEHSKNNEALFAKNALHLNSNILINIFQVLKRLF